MDRALLTGFSPEVIEKLLAADACPGVLLHPTDDVGETLSATDRDTYLFLAIGPEVDDAAAVSQRAHASHPGLRVTIIGDRDRLPPVRERVMLTPRIGSSVAFVQVDELADTVAALRKACDDALRARRYRAIIDALNTRRSSGPGPALSIAPHLDALMQGAPIGIVLARDTGEVVLANRRAYDMLCPQRPVQGVRLEEVLRSCGFSPAPGVGELLAQRDEIVRIERQSGALVLEVSAGPVEADQQGNAVLVVLIDVTARVEAEREQRRTQELTSMQKSLLESQTEAAFDGILVVDPDGKIVSFNQRFVQLWDMPKDVIESRSDEAAIKAVIDKVRDPEAFVSRIRYLYEHPLEESYDELMLEDGRVIERQSAPVRGDNDVLYGRVWFFRDVTDAKHHHEALQIAADAGEILAGTLDPGLIPQGLARLAVPRLADWCIIYVCSASGAIERMAIEHEEPDADAFLAALRQISVDPNADTGVPAVIRSGRPVLEQVATATSLSQDVVAPENLQSLLESLSVCSWMCVPMTARGRTLGAMAFATTRSGRRYTEQDLELAEDLAHRAALALDNAMLFEQRTNIARTLQQSLLPPEMPAAPGLSIATRYRAAGEGNDVGGDFYDMFSTGRKSWALVIGDVCGKGAEAAALTALTRYTIRTAAMQARKPSRILSILNEAIIRGHHGDRFCTVVYMKLQQVENGYLATAARGGHPPPIIIRAGGEIEQMAGRGGLIGVFSKIDLEEESTVLRPGDSLVMYTDGIIEARRGSELYGYDRLREALSTAASRDVESIADAITDDVLRFQEGNLRDDLALVVLTIGEPAQAQTDGATGSPRMHAQRQFPPEPRVLPQVRRFVASTLQGWGAASAEDVAILLANELAANSILHAATPFEVALEVTGEAIRVSVADAAAGIPKPDAFDPGSESGRGLALVEALSEQWGVEQVPDGKQVWFSLPLIRAAATSR